MATAGIRSGGGTLTVAFFKRSSATYSFKAIKNHCPDVGWSGLEEIAEDIEVVLYVA